MRWSPSLHAISQESQFSSVAQTFLTLCDPMDWSALGFPVLHYFPELAQIHIHLVSDVIQPSRPLLLPPLIFPSIRVFSNESGGQSIGASASASVLPMYIQGWFPLGLISLLSKGVSRIFSSTVQKHQFFSAQPFLQSNTQNNTWPLEKNSFY